MSTNLWNIQGPVKRIDFYYKIDEQKKHLLHLKNVKSTFQLHPQNHFFKNLDIEMANLSKVNSKKLNKIGQTSNNKQLRSLKIKSQRLATQDNKQDKQNFQNPYYVFDENLSNINRTCLSPTSSPNKYTKFRNRQIIQENEKLLKKLQNVRATPQLCKNILKHRYSKSDLKYRINLQKCKYKNVDFTKQAQKLIRGEKIKFDRINTSYIPIKTNQNYKINEINLDWKASKQNYNSPKSQMLSIPKLVR